MRTAATIVALLDEASILQLIEEIKNRPALYNKNIKQYTDMQIKKKLWMEVGEAVIPDWDKLNNGTKTQIGFEVLKKWNNLRTCFRREIKSQNGVGRKRRRKYVYYDNLQFLLPFTEKKDSKTDIMSFEDEMGPACYVPEGSDSDDENDDSNPSTSKPLKSEEHSDQTASDYNTSALVAILEKFKNNDKSSPFAAAVSAVLDESFIEKLIDTIEKRPGLYDKNKHYTDLHVKKRLWNEVCKEIIPHWDQLNDETKTQLNMEVQKKWSNLRACFRREVKLNNKPNKSLTKRKRRKYIYYDKLSFLLPHIESQSRPCDFKVEIEHLKCERDTDNSNAEHENDQKDNPPFYAGACYAEDEPEYNLEQANSQAEGNSINEDSDNNSEPSTTKRNTQPEKQNNHDQIDQSTTDMNFKATEFNVSLFKALLERMESGNEDKHFTLSLVPMLQEMTPEENIQAKINILKVFKDIRAARRGHTSNGATPTVSSQE